MSLLLTLSIKYNSSFDAKFYTRRKLWPSPDHDISPSYSLQLTRKYQPLVEQAPPHTPVHELSKKVKYLNVRSLMTSQVIWK